MDHRRIEERSLALHREIGAKIQQNPFLLVEVRQRLEKAVESERYSESVKDALREWVGILDQKPVNEILELLTDPGEEATRLRQSSPFAGILSEAERRRVFNRFYEIGRAHV